MKTVSILLLFLTSTLALPLGFSSIQATNQSDDDKTSSDDNQTNIMMENSTRENMGEQVSDFVHNATALFQQQRTETIEAIKDCHEKMKTATSENRTQIIDECHATLTTIREKYQDARNQFQELFKQFRESIIILRHEAEGLQISSHDRDDAIKNIDEDAAKHGITGLDIALGHLKGMGIGKAHANETGEYENQSGMSMAKSSDKGMHGSPISPGQSDSHGNQ